MTLAFCIAQLRHAYTHLKAGRVSNQQELADGLLSQVIQRLEALWTKECDDWRPITSFDRSNRDYVLITDGVCLPDLVHWLPERGPVKIMHRDGTGRVVSLGRPEGWYSVNGGSSRIRYPTLWMPVPIVPKEHPSRDPRQVESIPKR